MVHLSRGLALLVSALLTCLLPASAVVAGEIKAGGTGSATALLRVLGDAFAGDRQAGIEIVPSLGSSGGLRAVADGVLDLAVSARPLKPEEEAKGLRVVLTARTPLLFATSRANPDALSSSEIAAAYAAGTVTWKDGTPIKVILRPRAESDTALVAGLFPLLGPAVETARRRPEVPIAATDQDNAAMAEEIPGSLIAISMAQLALEKRSLRPLIVDGLAPTFASFQSGAYPHAKVLRFVVRGQPIPAVAAFIDFLRSPEGVVALRAAYLL